MVFYVNWDDSGLGFCMTGYNPLWPCPYMTEDHYPNSLRVIDEPLDDKYTVIKEPGPGPLNCCLLCTTPAIVALPWFIWKARAIFLEFSKHRDDKVYAVYRIKNLLWENNQKMVAVQEAWVDVTTVEEGGKKKKSYALVFTHRDGLFRWDDMDMTNSRWKTEVHKISDAVNRLIKSAPF